MALSRSVRVTLGLALGGAIFGALAGFLASVILLRITLARAKLR